MGEAAAETLAWGRVVAVALPEGVAIAVAFAWEGGDVGHSEGEGVADELADDDCDAVVSPPDGAEAVRDANGTAVLVVAAGGDAVSA